jgi:hypothetical protein
MLGEGSGSKGGGKRKSGGRKRESRGRAPPQFNTDLFYYPLVKLDTNSHIHILQSLTMVIFLDIHKLTVPYSEANTVISKLPAEDVDFPPMEISQKIDLVPSEKHKTRCTFKMNCKTKLDSNFRNLQNSF